ncbi:hypothetical protein CUU92_001494 [Salmonella enterica subsp. enterica serovar Cerro]|nr:hypothetical protein [Salmonella enterica subsp. enterica serovar Cerro]
MLAILTYCVYAAVAARTPAPNSLRRRRPFTAELLLLIAIFPEISKIFGLLI